VALAGKPARAAHENHGSGGVNFSVVRGQFLPWLDKAHGQRAAAARSARV
jgi:hypothetical protein